MTPDGTALYVSGFNLVFFVEMNGNILSKRWAIGGNTGWNIAYYQRVN